MIATETVLTEQVTGVYIFVVLEQYLPERSGIQYLTKMLRRCAKKTRLSTNPECLSMCQHNSHLAPLAN